MGQWWTAITTQGPLTHRCVRSVCHNQQVSPKPVLRDRLEVIENVNGMSPRLFLERSHERAAAKPVFPQSSPNGAWRARVNVAAVKQNLKAPNARMPACVQTRVRLSVSLVTCRKVQGPLKELKVLLWPALLELPCSTFKATRTGVAGGLLCPLLFGFVCLMQQDNLKQMYYKSCVNVTWILLLPTDTWTGSEQPCLAWKKERKKVLNVTQPWCLHYCPTRSVI